MHPILFQWQFITLRSYGLMMALGFAAGIFLAAWLNRKEQRSDDLIFDVAVWIMFGSITGARILYVLVVPEQFHEHPLEAFAIWKGGLVYYGGLIGAGFTA